MWVKFDSIEDFNSWHLAIKEQLGLPKISVDSEGNEVAEAVVTTDYTIPVIVSETDVRALVEDELADGLEVSENPVKSEYETLA